MRIEDAFLRSIAPGRAGGEPPAGLLLDRSGAHYDPRTPSDLENLLATHPLDDQALLDRARLCAHRLQALELSKYNSHDPALPLPDPGFVLVVDQVRGDASIRHGGLDGPLPPNLFQEMLVAAQAEHPGAQIVIKTHPETRSGARRGHFGPDTAGPRVTLLDAPVAPWALLDRARAVYTVSSQLGYEAIFAGHRPRVFGMPFYAGWGLTGDEAPHPRRRRRLTRAQLFAGAMLLYPLWYDPTRDRLCRLEDVIDQFDALTRAWREDRNGHIALGMRLWKRAPLQGFFGQWKRLRFAASDAEGISRARASGAGLLVWAGKESADLDSAAVPTPLRRVEDGFLRSRGLGAELTPPLSLVTDDLGIYYDPRRESRLERLIAAPPPPGALERADALIAALRARGLSKYNIGGAIPDLPQGWRVLVPGQVEDDASIQLGAGQICTNLQLLQCARAANPDAVILFKPHPDVEAGLRKGAVAPGDALAFCDMIVSRADPAALIEAVDEVWTMTSAMGFEALLRGKPVTTTGAPFYAGWGLTTDLGPVPARRTARPPLAQLVHAALIAYPRYRDPVTGLPCPVELIVERLAAGQTGPKRPALRLLSRLQGVLASRADWWR